MKICTKCKKNKPKGEFSNDSSRKDGLQAKCRECVDAYNKERRATIVGKEQQRVYNKSPRGKSTRKNSTLRYLRSPRGIKIQRNNHLKRKYGITLDQYDNILESQGGVCAICGTDTPGGKGRFHVDHDHKTGKIRGLLCVKCNLTLGGVSDNINILVNAIKYLSKV